MSRRITNRYAPVLLWLPAAPATTAELIEFGIARNGARR